MKKASAYTYLKKPVSKPANKISIQSHQLEQPLKMAFLDAQQQDQGDLNVFVVTFNSMKQAQKHLAGGDPYFCKKCKAILNKYSKIMNQKQLDESHLGKLQIQLKPNQSIWQCEFCHYPNQIRIERQQIPQTQDVFYMLQSQHDKQATDNDSTLIFCIDTSGSMNTTSQVKGKVDLKFGLSQQQIDMLKAFMQPGDQAQFNFLPGQHNKDKTFISRKQCILSAIQNHLQDLKKHEPFKRVGFVTFNNEVTIIGDSKANTVNIVGDKLNKKEDVLNSIKQFKLTQPLAEVYSGLIDSLNKVQAKGQTALGPALMAAIQVASKGSPGSTVTLCTDGLANIGFGLLDPLTQEQKKFYEQLATVAKQRNISVNIMTIKGQGCKMEIIGKLAQATNGNMKVVNPQKLSEDFANVMKDQVVGLNVNTKIMLHKAMAFRNQDPSLLKEQKTIMYKQLPNATVNTKISFEYQLRPDQDLQFMEIDIQKLKTVPFQAQIQFTSPKGGRFLRVVSSQSKTTTSKEQIKKQANLPVVHHRIGSKTAQMYSQGDYEGSKKMNNKWSDFLGKNFVQEEFQQQQKVFQEKNARLNKAIKHKYEKFSMPEKKLEKKQMMEVPPPPSISLGGRLSSLFTKDKKKKQNMKSEIKQQKIQSDQDKKSQVDSDQDQMQLMDNVMQKGSYNMD